jgi:group I intron endonuclease
MNGKVYIIRNDINDKVYIGQTVRSLKQRFDAHCQPCNADRTVLSRAIQEYGKEHFWIEELASGISEPRDLNYLEVLYICTYRSVYPDGYNNSFGGTWSPERGAHTTPIDWDIVRDYESGLSIPKVAKKHSCSRTKVFNHLRKAGVKSRQAEKRDE